MKIITIIIIIIIMYSTVNVCTCKLEKADIYKHTSYDRLYDITDSKTLIKIKSRWQNY